MCIQSACIYTHVFVTLGFCAVRAYVNIYKQCRSQFSLLWKTVAWRLTWVHEERDNEISECSEMLAPPLRCVFFLSFSRSFGQSFRMRSTFEKSNSCVRNWKLEEKVGKQKRTARFFNLHRTPTSSKIPLPLRFNLPVFLNSFIY